MKYYYRICIFIGSWLFISHDPLHAQVEIFQGQAPAQEVSTTSRPVDTLTKRIFDFEGLVFSCDFLSGRLNDVSRQNDSVFKVLINAENYPINLSPWYAFNITGTQNRKIFIDLNYTKSKHRYYPKYSRDGKNWQAFDSANVEYILPGKEKFGAGSMPESARFIVQLKKNETVWIAAQEIASSHDVYEWMKHLPANKKISNGIAGYSTWGKPIRFFKIGKEKKYKPSVVIISRQHPPEVTGYFAMQKFVEVLLNDDRLSKKYRKKYVTYVVPLMNPDGVDHGHWRHNAGGVDLNRDWQQQNQPEVKQVNYLLDSLTSKYQSNILFFIDFHSTWDDIFYTNSVTHQSNCPGLLNEMLSTMEASLQQGSLNIKPSEKNESFMSKGYFYNRYHAESVTYEVGDNTSRERIDLKGKIAATSFLKTLFKLK